MLGRNPLCFLVLLPLLLSASEAPESAYEVLRRHGLPIGLLPKGVQDFRIDEEGRFEVHLQEECTAKFETDVHYKRNVTGTLSYGEIAAISGVTAHELFLWFPVRGIRVDIPSTGLIYFDVGVIYKQFSLSLFETPPDCSPASHDRFREGPCRPVNESRLIVVCNHCGCALESIDYWMKFFRNTKSNIFELTDKVLLITAVECSMKFKGKMDQIVENLFTSRLSWGFRCNHAELQVRDDDRDTMVEEESVKRDLGEKDSTVASCNYDPKNLFKSGEVLIAEIEEGSKIVGEVLRIKKILYNNQVESDAVLYELLKSLHLIQLSIETQKSTKIGRWCLVCENRSPKRFVNLLRLIDSWKVLIDEWIKVKSIIVIPSADFVNPSMVDEGA